MPKSFLNVIFALAVLAIPVFFAVLFLGSARQKKRLRRTVMAQLDDLVNQLRQRNEVLLETLRSSPGGSAHAELLRLRAEGQQELLNRFEASPRNLKLLSELDSAVESDLLPWLQSIPDSYGKRKLVPLQEQASQARTRYNDAARICGQGTFPLLAGAGEG